MSAGSFRSRSSTVGDRFAKDRAMHRLTAIATAGFALTFAAGIAGASEPLAATITRADRCAQVPGGQFRSEADLKATVEGFGYQLVQVGTDAGCYAVLAVDARGKRFDMRFEGANLRMVSRYIARTEPEVVAQR
jgi:hypothetical protein